MTIPSYEDMRRSYVSARIEEILRAVRPVHRQTAKDQAHREFNEFVQVQRDAAAYAARLPALASGWDDGWLHRGAHADPTTDEYGHNPYRTLIREQQQAELDAIRNS